MRFRILNILFTIVVIFIVPACQDINNSINTDKTNKKKNIENTNFINTLISENDDIIGFLEAKCMKLNTGNSPNYYQVSARILQNISSSNHADVGKVVISDFIINSADSTNTYFYDFPSNATIIPKFGSNGKFSIEGNSLFGIPSIDSTIYVPKELIVSNTFSNDEISRNESLNLKWNIDNNSNYDCHIVITNSTNPDSIISWYKKVPDTGNYTIDTDVLQQFPADSEINLFLTRGNGAVIEKENKKFLLVGYSFCWLILTITN